MLPVSVTRQQHGSQIRFAAFHNLYVYTIICMWILLSLRFHYPQNRERNCTQPEFNVIKLFAAVNKEP
jgi:hypothetical protein